MTNEIYETQDESEIDDDREGLGFRRFGQMAMGVVSHVNGDDSLPCPEYVPTCHELLELAGYWANQVLFIETTFYYEQQIGSDDWRIVVYGVRRVNRIIELLGWDVVEPVVSAIEDRYRQQMGDRDWAIFKGQPDDDDKVNAMFAEKYNSTAPGYSDGE